MIVIYNYLFLTLVLSLTAYYRPLDQKMPHGTTRAYVMRRLGALQTEVFYPRKQRSHKDMPSNELVFISVITLLLVLETSDGFVSSNKHQIQWKIDLLRIEQDKSQHLQIWIDRQTGTFSWIPTAHP